MATDDRSLVWPETGHTKIKKRLATTILAIGLVASACSAAPTRTPPAPEQHLSVTTAADTTETQHKPYWISVKYRSGAVDVADPRFVFLNGGSSSLVDAAFYDAANEYMIVSLDGTAYHYCGMPSSVWSSFTAASSLGSFYRSRIKGNFDCRSGFVPEY